MTVRNLPWVRDRVQYGHHRVLASYLCTRSAAQRAEADAAGLGVNAILGSFRIDNGHTAVPMAAMKVLRRLPDEADARIVLALCMASRDGRQAEALGALLRRLQAMGHHGPGGAVKECLDLLAAVEVHRA